MPLEPVAFSEEAPGVEAEANLIAHTWGTETRLVTSGLEKGQTYRVVLLDEDGEVVPSGAFIGTGDEPVECNLNATLLRENATGLVVRSATGEVMLSADLSESAGNRGNAALASEPETVEVPGVRDLGRGAAVDMLREAGFEVEVAYEESAPAGVDKILDQNPSGGEGSRAERGSKVLLVVGKGSGGERAGYGVSPNPAESEAGGEPPAAAGGGFASEPPASGSSRGSASASSSASPAPWDQYSDYPAY